jgi:hypothetical protein
MWRSRRGVGSPNARRLHPTRIGTHAATIPKGRGGGLGTVHPGPGPMLLRSRSPGHSSRLAHPRKDVPFVGARVRGRRRGLLPGGEGGGERVSVALRCHSSSSRRLCRAHSWTGRKTRVRCTCPRPLPPPGVHSPGHIGSSPQGVFGSCKGGIGGPSPRLAARVPTSNAPLGLTGAVITRCHSHSHSTCDSALSLGLTRLAPVRLWLADPPSSEVLQPRTKRVTSNTFLVRNR